MAVRQADIQIKLDDFNVEGLISKGSFGAVYKVKRKSDGKIFALKQVNLDGMKRVDREETIDEARVLASLDSPYVISHFGSFIEGNVLHILMEYASKGNLHQIIKSFKGKGLPEDATWKYFLQSLLGLAHIHSRKIIHRDIKSLNLFLDEKLNIKVGDLGIARALNQNSIFAHTIVGTPYYLSPELCDDKPYNEKSDVWALGVVLYECIMGRHPFESQNEGALIRKILSGQYPPVQGASSSLKDIVSLCLAFDANKRPSAVALLQNPMVVSKAKALGIDLSGRRPEAKRPKAEGPSPSPQPSDEAAGADSTHLFAAKLQNKGAPARQAVDMGAERRSPAVEAAARQGPYGEPIVAAALNRGASPHVAAQQAAVPENRNLVRNNIFGGDENAADERYQAVGIPQGDQKKDIAAALARQHLHMMPAAGKRVALDDHHGGPPGKSPLQAPYSLQYNASEDSQYHRDSAEQQAALWNAQYQPPQFARKRCHDLQITGPSMRDAGTPAAAAARRQQGGPQQGAPSYVALSASTTTVHPSTYVASSMRRI